jgi:hypothetical protein
LVRALNAGKPAERLISKILSKISSLGSERAEATALIGV